MAGYTVGTKRGYLSALSTPSSSEATISAEPIPTIEAESPAPKETSIETPVEPAATDAESFALRAQQSTINLTDTNNRSLEGEFLAVSEQHLQVRRKSDGLVVDVPLTMLCSEDQAFAAYLLQENKVSNQPAISESDKIWDEIFKGM